MRGGVAHKRCILLCGDLYKIVYRFSVPAECHTNAVHLIQTTPAGLLVGPLVVSHDGYHLYAAQAAGSADPFFGYFSGIVHWRIRGDGTLEFSEVTRSGGAEVRGMAIAHDDSFLAAVNYASATVAFFSLTTPDRIPQLLGTLRTSRALSLWGSQANTCWC